jgi:hypothetical protein
MSFVKIKNKLWNIASWYGIEICIWYLPLKLGKPGNPLIPEESIEDMPGNGLWRVEFPWLPPLPARALGNPPERCNHRTFTFISINIYDVNIKQRMFKKLN